MVIKKHTNWFWVVWFALLFWGLNVQAQVRFTVEKLPNANTYQVSMLPEVTWQPPFNITNSAQLTIRVPTGGFLISSINSLIPNVTWEANVRIDQPSEAPDFDYISFAMTTMASSALTYEEGQELPLFTFENGSICTGSAMIIDENDPFYPPNSQSANIGNLLLTLGAGNHNAYAGRYGHAIATCELCEVSYSLEKLPNDAIQVSVFPETTWNFPDNATNTAQIVVVVPTGGFEVANFTNLIPDVEFEFNAQYVAPVENPNFDYLVFALNPGGTYGIEYQEGQAVPLFKFENGGNCIGGTASLMTNENDPFYPPNSQNVNIQQQLTTVGSGPDANVCVFGNGVLLCEAGGQTETIYLTLPPNAPFDTCLNHLLPNVAGNISTESICAINPNETTAFAFLNGCMTLDPVDGFAGVTEVCLQFCDNFANCDTVLVIAEVLPCNANHPIYQQPSAAIAPVAPIFCTDGTEDILLDATPSGGSGNYTFQWSGPNNFDTNTEDVNLIDVQENLSGNYALTLIDSYGCHSNPTVVAVEISDNLPKPIIQADVGFCAGNTLTLTDANNFGNNFSYQWNIPANATNTVNTNTSSLIINNLNANNNNGNYTLTIQTAQCAQTSDPFQIQVTENPVTQPTVEVDAGNCNGSVQLFANASGTGTFSYQWSGPSPNVFSSTQANPLIDPAGADHNGTFSVTVTNNFNCTATGTVQVSGINNQVTQPIITSSGPACLGGEITLSVLPYSGLSVQYAWLRDNIVLLGETSNQLILQPVTEANAGFYELQVQVDGCVAISNLYEIDVLEQPTATLDFALSDGCEGGTLQLFSNVNNAGSNVSYQWTGPDNFLSNAANPLIFNTTIQQQGTYTLSVLAENGCQTNVSILVEGIATIPEQPQVMDNGPVCETGIIILSVQNTTPPTSYFWANGNGDIIGTEPTIQIGAASLEAVQPFQAFATNGNCESLGSALVTVNIGSLAAPMLTSNTSVLCEGETLELTSSQVTGVNVTYEWYKETGGNFTLLSVTTTPTFSIDNATIANAGNYAVLAIADGCATDYSNLEGLTVIADNAFLQATNSTSQNEPACVGELVQLALPIFPNATYQWFGPLGFNSSLPNPIINSVSLQAVGDYFAIITLDDCTTTSLPTTVFVRERPDAPVLLNDSPVCEGETVTFGIQNEPIIGTNIFFELFDENGISILDSIATTTFQSTDLQVINNGNYRLSVSVDGCESDLSPPTEVQIDTILPNIALAGQDVLLCNDEEAIELQAPMPSIGTGKWTSPTGALLANPDLAATLAMGLRTSENLFIWSLSNGACQDYSTDTLSVFLEQLIALDDEFTLHISDSLIAVDLLKNEEFALLEGWEWTLLSEPSLGLLTEAEGGIMSYLPTENRFGIDTFDYQLCSKSCPDLCATATVRISIEGVIGAVDSDKCFVPNTITPDGDGVNDFLEIPCATIYEGSALQIFNRWGDLIFQTDNYQNDWAGTYDNQPVPVGTYYYQLVLSDPERRRKQGFIVVLR